MFGHGTIGTITMAIENGLIVPRVQGKLSIPVFDDLHQVAPLARSKAIRPPVIKDQQIGFRNSRG